MRRELRRLGWLAVPWAVGALAFSCGSDGGGTGSGGSGASAGSSVDGSAATSGSGASSGAAGSGGADAASCLDPALVPALPSVSPATPAACAEPSGCTDAIGDGRWELTSHCVAAADLVPQAQALCSSATTTLVGAAATGALTTSGSTWQLDLTLSGSAVITFPNACGSCACGSIEASLVAAGVGSAKCNPECQAGSCTCTVDVGFELEQAGTIDSAQGVLVTTAPSHSYCASAGSLTLSDISQTPRFGSITFAKSEPGQELCNGLDDDVNGTVDDDPVDCAPCPSTGVCAGGSSAECVGGSWQCSFPSTYEPDEVSCDGLDNDCDGTIDEPAGCQEVCDGLDNDNDGSVDEDLVDTPSCPAKSGVCSTAGTPVCNGASGWSCEYSNPAHQAVETSCDGVDNDCDGAVDESCANCASVERVWRSFWSFDPVSFITSYGVSWQAVGNSTSGTIASGIGSVDRVRADDVGQKIYYTADDVMRANFDGTGKEKVVDGSALALAISSSGQWIYWSSGTTIRRAPMSNPASIETIANVTYTTNLAATADVLYFSDNPGLHLSAPDGSAATAVDPQASVAGLAVDLVSNRLYWVDAAVVYASALDGTGVTTVVNLPTSAAGIHDLAVDPWEQRLYLAVNSGVATVNTDGTGLSAIPSASSSFSLESVAVSGCLAP